MGGFIMISRTSAVCRGPIAVNAYPNLVASIIPAAWKLRLTLLN